MNTAMWRLRLDTWELQNGEEISGLTLGDVWLPEGARSGYHSPIVDIIFFCLCRSVNWSSSMRKHLFKSWYYSGANKQNHPKVSVARHWWSHTIDLSLAHPLHSPCLILSQFVSPSTRKGYVTMAAHPQHTRHPTISPGPSNNGKQQLKYAIHLHPLHPRDHIDAAANR